MVSKYGNGEFSCTFQKIQAFIPEWSWEVSSTKFFFLLITKIILVINKGNTSVFMLEPLP